MIWKNGPISSDESCFQWIEEKKWSNYQESVDYVRDLCESKIAGFNDWRLPSREEMDTLFNKSYSLKDKFEKIIHISECFSPGGGFSMIA